MTNGQRPWASCTSDIAPKMSNSLLSSLIATCDSVYIHSAAAAWMPFHQPPNTRLLDSPGTYFLYFTGFWKVFSAFCSLSKCRVFVKERSGNRSPLSTSSYSFQENVMWNAGSRTKSQSPHRSTSRRRCSISRGTTSRSCRGRSSPETG